MNLPHDTLVLVCDAAKALVLRNHGDADRMDLRVVGALSQDNPPDRALSADRPGRMPTPTGGRTAMEETDRHEAAEDRFIGEALAMLAEVHSAHPGAGLVVIADPRSLGRLRSGFGALGEVEVLAEIDKDYAGHPVEEIERLLREA